MRCAWVPSRLAASGPFGREAVEARGCRVFRAEVLPEAILHEEAVAQKVRQRDVRESEVARIQSPRLTLGQHPEGLGALLWDMSTRFVAWSTQR